MTPADLRSLPDGYRAIVVGASGGLGAALADALAADPRCASVDRLSRRSPIPIDFDDERSIVRAADALAGPFHLLINATGVLHREDLRPEKRLANLDLRSMEAVFRVNAFGPALLLAHFSPRLDPRRAIVAMLSAKVGSIGDNRLGGWTSYRASKAALNMVVRNAAIEWSRTRPGAVVVAVHPGTVDTPLSRPFGGEAKGRAPALAAADILRTLDPLTTADSGAFVAYDGARLPW